MRAGYLRKNGVPYSEDALLTEYFDLAPHANRRSAAGRDVGRRRPEVLAPAVHRELAVQETDRRVRVGADAVLGDVVKTQGPVTANRDCKALCHC